MSELAAGLAATANEPVADSPATPDSVLDTAFESPSEPAAGSEPSETPDPDAQPVAATQQPQDPAPQSGVKGEPPRERWDSILENARKKAREEALEAHKDALDVVRQLQANPGATIAQLLEEAAGDERYSEFVTSRAAAILAARNKAATQDARPEPDQGDDKFVWYSPEQQQRLDEWKERQIEKKLSERFAPLQQLQQRLEQHQQQVKATEEVAQTVSERWSQWESMPFLKENMDAIKQRQGEIYAEIEAQGKQGLRRFDPKDAPFEALQRAYSEVVSTQALPKLRSAQTGQFIADAARKRAGSSSDPAAHAPAQPRKPLTPDEALDQVFGAVV